MIIDDDWTPRDADEWVLNGRLARLLGLLQILDADGGPRVCGRNAHHVAVAACGACLLATAALAPAGLRRVAGDVTAFTFYTGCVGNYAFACYKASVVVAQARRIRRCADVAAAGFMRAHGRYGRATFARWRGRSVRATGAYAAMTAFVLCVWAATPRAFPGVSVTVRRAEDGARDAYRMNVFNVYPMVSDGAYNGHYEAFYAVECVVLVCFLYASVLFDVLVVTVCLAITCQLDAVCEAVRELGYDDTSAAQSSLLLHDDKKQVQNVNKLGKQINVFNDLKNIIEDHQTVFKKLEDFYNIFRSVILSQIFVASSSHVLIWFIAAMNFSKGDTGDSILTIKLFTVLPVFTFQLLMTCYLFGIINEKKEELIFSLYSSNWTDMDLKSKELILCTMKINNANQLKMKVTRTKIVNLEMFSQTMRLCYSIFSMLINYKKK